MSGMDRLTDEALERDDTGRVTCDYEPTALEVEVARGAICREFGNNGTDGYYIRIVRAVIAAHRRASQAAPAPSDGLRAAAQALAWALPAEGDTIDRMRAMLWSSPEGRALNNRGAAKLYWLNEGDVCAAMLISASPAQEGEPRRG